MSYLALYRKWRPRTFSEVVGQHHISDTLQRAVASGKVAHAYLFSGPRGTGKTSMAKIMAKAVNCENSSADGPCNTCSICRDISNGTSLDVYEIDAASNRGIEEIRSLRESVQNLPARCRKKVYIIDEVHMLTKEAFNALLKTLEEPPAHVLFILATTEPGKIPLTILSRCQRYEFRRISIKDMKDHLLYVAEKSGISIEEDAAELIAVQADGGLRDALSLLDQCSGMTEGTITSASLYELLGMVGKDSILSLAEKIFAHESGAVLKQFYDILQTGKEPGAVLRDLLSHFRDVMICRIDSSLPELSVYGRNMPRLKEESRLFTDAYLGALFDSLQQSIREVQNSISPRMNAEMGLLRLCRLKETDTADLEKRVSRLEKCFSSEGQPLVPAADHTLSAISRTASSPSAVSIPKPAVRAELPVSDVPPSKAKTSKKRNPLPPEKEKKSIPVQSGGLVRSDPHVPVITDPASYENIWHQILDYFMDIKRIDILACFQKSRLILLEDSHAVISAPQQFLVLAANNKSYQDTAAQAFLKVTGTAAVPHTVLTGSDEEEEAIEEARQAGSSATNPASPSSSAPDVSRPAETSESSSSYHLIDASDIPAEDKENPVLAEALKFMPDCDIYEK